MHHENMDMDAVWDRLNMFLAYEKGWVDGKNGRTLSAHSTERTVAFLKECAKVGIERPGIFLDETGHIRLEWFRNPDEAGKEALLVEVTVFDDYFEYITQEWEDVHFTDMVLLAEEVLKRFELAPV